MIAFDGCNKVSNFIFDVDVNVDTDANTRDVKERKLFAQRKEVVKAFS